jgi:hypothetical protein
MIADAWKATTPAKRIAGIARLGPGPGMTNLCIIETLSSQRSITFVMNATMRFLIDRALTP